MRRSSGFLGSFPLNDELQDSDTSGKVVVYTAVAVPEEMRIRAITISSMQYLKKAVRKFRADTFSLWTDPQSWYRFKTLHKRRILFSHQVKSSKA